MTENRLQVQPGTGCVDTCTPNAEFAVLAALSAAVELAHAGDCQRARELCAAAIFEVQPLIAASKELLRVTLHALLVARGFKLISRLVRALSGLEVRMILMPQREGHGAAPQRGERAGCVIYTLDPDWLCRLSPNDVFLRSWSDALADQRRAHSTVKPARHLELA